MCSKRIIKKKDNILIVIVLLKMSQFQKWFFNEITKYADQIRILEEDVYKKNQIIAEKHKLLRKIYVI